MDAQASIAALEGLLQRIASLRGTDRERPEFVQWRLEAADTLRAMFQDQDGIASRFESIRYRRPNAGENPEPKVVSLNRGLDEAEGQLNACISRVKARSLPLGTVAGDPLINGSIVPVELINLCKRFNLFATQLVRRREQRATLIINDEYDVQDAIHALLKLHFNDVRPEEPTPSFGGKSARMDFFLKPEQCIIEAKMPRDKSHAQKIGDELLVDIARYEKRPDCRSLVCLIYDPKGFIHNHASIKELEATRSQLTVQVVITPCAI